MGHHVAYKYLEFAHSISISSLVH